MFVRDEVMLDVGFDEARDRLAKLDRWFPDASDDVYREEIAVLAPIGPPGPAPGASGLAAIRLQSLAARDGRAGLALRWEVRGAAGLFPVLDADLTLAPAGEDAALLTLAGAYRPPLGNLGAELDRLLLHRVADATIRHFLDRVAAALGRRSRGSGPPCS